MTEKTFDVDLTKAGGRPVIGVSSDPFAAPIYRYDDTGRIIEERGVTETVPSKAQRARSGETVGSRVGDYYYDNSGNLNVVPNSPTDIFNKWKITNDTSLSFKPSKSDYVNPEVLASPALSFLGGSAGAGIGATVGSKMAAGAAAGSLAGAGLVLLPGLAIGGVLSAQQMGAQEKAYKKALEDWQKIGKNLKSAQFGM